jgi:KH domain-containing protein
MTEKIYLEKTRVIITNKRKIESTLKVNLEINNKIITIEGESEKEMIALMALEAIELGFSIESALDLKIDDFTFKKIQIKNISKRHDLSQVRARVIGTKRRALDQLESLTGCDIVLHDNTIGIIGPIEDVDRASYALKKLISGSKHANVYALLEEQNAKEKAGIW